MQAERYSNSEQNKMTRVRMKVRANADHSTLPSRRECSIENSQELAFQLQRQKKPRLITLEANTVMIGVKVQSSAII